MQAANSFDPTKYETESYSIENDDINSDSYAFADDSSSEYVEKGHKKKINIDIGHFDTLCKKFKEKKNLKIKQLQGQDLEDFNQVVSNVHQLYDTDYYIHLHDKVKKYFGDLESVKPGTIAGYFAGCLVNTTYDDKPGCSVACAGSVPLPKEDDGWGFCDKVVIMTEKDKNGYKFDIIKPAEEDVDYDPAYVFVEHTNLHDFKGFSKDEIDELKRIGCKKINLVGYADDGVTYSELYGMSKELDDIKRRVSHKHKSKNTSKNKSKKGKVLVALLIVISLILVAGLSWKYLDLTMFSLE